MSIPEPFPAYFKRLFSAADRNRTTKTVEVFGWLIFVEGGLLLLAPRLAWSILRLGELGAEAENIVRLVGLLVGGIGMLYVVSGRMGAMGFAFGSLLDRPLVPPIMLVLWWLDVLPGTLALLFALQDGVTCLWTFLTWRAEARARE